MGMRKQYELYDGDKLIAKGDVYQLCNIIPMSEYTARFYARNGKLLQDRYTIKYIGFEKKVKKKPEKEDYMLRSLKYYGNTILDEKEMKEFDRLEKELGKISVEKRLRIWEGKNEGYYYYLEVMN